MGDKPYNEILQESLKMNYDLDVKLPNRDSQKILDIYMPKTQKATAPSDQPTRLRKQHRYSESGSSYGPTPFSSPQKEKGRDPSASSNTSRDTRKRQQDSPDDTATKSTKKQDRRDKTENNVKIYRNKEDPTALPDKITNEWFTAQILQAQADYGLKVMVWGAFDMFMEHLEKESLAPTRAQIRVIDPKTFQQLPRIDHHEP